MKPKGRRMMLKPKDIQVKECVKVKILKQKKTRVQLPQQAKKKMVGVIQQTGIALHLKIPDES